MSIAYQIAGPVSGGFFSAQEMIDMMECIRMGVKMQQAYLFAAGQISALSGNGLQNTASYSVVSTH